MPKKKKYIHPDTRRAICRAIRYLDNDAKIAGYVSAPFEGLTAADVARVRKEEIIAGNLMPAERIIGSNRLDQSPIDRLEYDLARDEATAKASRMLARAIVRIHA